LLPHRLLIRHTHKPKRIRRMAGPAMFSPASSVEAHNYWFFCFAVICSLREGTMYRIFKIGVFVWMIALALASKFLSLPTGVLIGLWVLGLSGAAAVFLWEWWVSFATGVVTVRGTTYSRQGEPIFFQLGRWLNFILGLGSLSAVGWLLTQLTSLTG
jgi:hypothetical protein